MTRDMEVVRKILLGMEARENDDSPIEVGECDEATFYFHVWLMSEAELITVMDGRTRADPNRLYPRHITWKGYDFLDSARSESVWRETLSKIGSAVGTVAFSVLLESLKDATMRKLGLR